MDFRMSQFFSKTLWEPYYSDLCSGSYVLYYLSVTNTQNNNLNAKLLTSTRRNLTNIRY
jgi:hypothetical protein